jgi:hypothetical protein
MRLNSYKLPSWTRHDRYHHSLHHDLPCNRDPDQRTSNLHNRYLDHGLHNVNCIYHHRIHRDILCAHCHQLPCQTRLRDNRSDQSLYDRVPRYCYRDRQCIVIPIDNNNQQHDYELCHCQGCQIYCNFGSLPEWLFFRKPIRNW